MICNGLGNVFASLHVLWWVVAPLQALSIIACSVVLRRFGWRRQSSASARPSTLD
jgi:hypothetical protein